MSATVTTATTISYSLTVDNSGTATASSVTITDALPAGTTLDSATGSFSEAGGIVTWDLGSMAVGDSTTVTLTVLAD